MEVIRVEHVLIVLWREGGREGVELRGTGEGREGGEGEGRYQKSV